MAGIILNYTTEVSPQKSLGEITQTLIEFGATNISIDYDRERKIPTGLSFTVETPIGDREFRLPARIERVQKILKDKYNAGDRRIGPRHTTFEHAARVAWRVLKDWVEAQIAMVKLDLITVDELFLPQMIAGRRGETVYQLFEGRALLGPGKEGV
jgi:uncharacterized protein YqgV (UPF0045/DUF77 family)